MLLLKKQKKEYNKLLTETESFLDKETKYIKIQAMKNKHNGKIIL